MTHSNPHHDRLDLKLHTLEYTGPLCGSANLKTGKKEYCDFDCPVLKGTQPEPVQLSPKDVEKASLKARLAELEGPSPNIETETATIA
jgi:hypothetical protein